MQITPLEQTLIDNHPTISVAALRAVAVTVNEIVHAEREACAKIADEYWMSIAADDIHGDRIAAKIRARSSMQEQE